MRSARAEPFLPAACPRDSWTRLPAPASLLLRLTLRARGPGPRRGCRPRPFRAARRSPRIRPPAGSFGDGDRRFGGVPPTCDTAGLIGGIFFARSRATRAARRPLLCLVLGEPKPGAKPTALVLQFAAEGDADKAAPSSRTISKLRRIAIREMSSSGHPATAAAAGTVCARLLLQSNPELAALHTKMDYFQTAPWALRLRVGNTSTMDPPPPQSVFDDDPHDAERRTVCFAARPRGRAHATVDGLANALDADVKGARRRGVRRPLHRLQREDAPHLQRTPAGCRRAFSP